MLAAYLLASWGWRTWEFAIALLLLGLYPESLVLVAAFGLLDDLVKVVSGSSVGDFVDRYAKLLTDACHCTFAFIDAWGFGGV
jgi:iron-regulated transporter 1